MPNVKRLDEAEIAKKLTSLSDWHVIDGALHREFKFRDFVEAFSFMTAAAFIAERMGHHPDWTNVYNKVNVRLTTHDAGGISEKDFELAAELSAIHKKS
ncbi:MAG TPA: 4a-hydroxytetrahydrobiopterin dehydratase [Thermoanaerobaculia bacterium]